METPRNQSEWVILRDAEIARLRSEDISVIEIAARYSISPQRVYQILEKQQLRLKEKG